MITRVVTFTETRIYFKTYFDKEGYRYTRVFDDGYCEEGTEFGIFEPFIQRLRRKRKLLHAKDVWQFSFCDNCHQHNLELHTLRMLHLRERPKLP